VPYDGVEDVIKVSSPKAWRQSCAILYFRVNYTEMFRLSLGLNWSVPWFYHHYGGL